jgi:chromosome segregation ATPase
MPRKKSEKEHPSIEDLPEPLRKCFVKLLAKYNLSIKEGFKKLATLSDVNSRIFDEKVKKEAERRYKARFLSQLNKARATIQKKADKEIMENFDYAFNEGFECAKNDFRIHYFCPFCGEAIYLTPGSEAHQSMITYMREHGWGHQACHKKQRGL